MANKGLRSYTKQITKSLSCGASVSINLNKNDKNSIVKLPLTALMNNCPFNLSLVYNPIGETISVSNFGLSTYLSGVSYINIVNGSIDVYSCDGTKDTYNSEGNNWISDTTYSKITYDSTAGDYIITDKNGNKEYIKYSVSAKTYKIEFETGEVINVEYDANNSYRLNRMYIEYTDGFIEQLRFNYSVGCNFVTSITYYEGTDQAKYMLEITYSDSDVISGMELKGAVELGFSSVPKSKLECSFSGNNVYIKDLTTLEELDIEHGANFSYITVTGSYAESITLLYTDNKTKVTSGKTPEYYLIFDDNDMPLMEINEFGQTVKYKYNNRNELIYCSPTFQSFNTHENSHKFGLNEFYDISNPSKTKNLFGSVIPATSLSEFTPYARSILADGVYRCIEEGTFRYEVDVSELEFLEGLPNESITAVMFSAPSGITNANQFRFKVSTDSESRLDYISDVVASSYEAANIYDLTAATITTTKSYKKIYVDIIFDEAMNQLIGGLQIFNSNSGINLSYDENGNVVSLESSNALEVYEYDEFSRLSKQKGGLVSSLYVNNSTNNYRLETYPYGVEKLIQYNDRNNTTSEVINAVRSGISKKTSFTYDSSKKNIVSEKDSLNNQIEYETDIFGKIKKVEDALGIIESTFDEAEKMTSMKALTPSLGQTGNVEYTYENDLIKKITLSNGDIYEYTYDNNFNITSLKINGILHVGYTYQGDLVKTIKYGNNQSYYKFDYITSGINNRKVRLIEYFDELGNLADFYEYNYDEEGRLRGIVNFIGDEVYYYYDKNSRLIKVKCNDEMTTLYQYSDDGSLLKTTNVDNKKIYTFNDSLSKTKEFYPEVIEDILSNEAYLIQPFEKYVADNTEEYNSLQLKHKTCFDGRFIYETIRENNLSYIEIDHGMLEYKPETRTDENGGNGTVAFYFKPATEYEETFMDEEQNPYYEMVEYDYNGKCIFSNYNKVASDKKIVYVKIDNDKLSLCFNKRGTTTTLLTTENKVSTEQWNYFSLSWDIYYQKMYLTLNDRTYTCNASGYIQNYCDDYFGIFHYYDTVLNRSVDNLMGKITLLMISTNCLQGEESLVNYRNLTREYIENIKWKDPSIKSTYVDSTSQIIDNSVVSQFEVFPMSNSVNSLNGKKPYQCELRKRHRNDKLKGFEFDNKTGQFVYSLEGSDLKYEIGEVDDFTVLMDVYIHDTGTNQTLFDMIDDTASVVKLYRNTDGVLYIRYETSTYNTGIAMTPYEWHKVGVSIKDYMKSSSLSIYPSKAIRIYYDGEIREYTYSLGGTYQSITLSIGKENGDINPASGKLKLLAYNHVYGEENTITSFLDSAERIIKYSSVNELGIVMKSAIKKNNQDILSNTYTYKRHSTATHFWSDFIASESIKFGTTNNTRSYTTDQRGNVESITDSIFGNHSYEYDDRGFLTKEDDTITYTYDSNGNITSKGNVTYSYDSTIKDKLTFVGTKGLTYDTNNPFLISSYDGASFIYEGRRLATHTKNGITSTYKYNHQGLRTSKVVGTLETKYYYDGNNLITQISGTNRIDFLYDSHNLLYGFIYNNNNYYYVRDCLQDILGIIDSNGNLVVKYSCDAWGDNQTITDTSGINLGTINPFRYKGFYYDEETQLFYCNSRYYNPEWGRWLTPDSIEYLEPYNINGLNLYCYCFNNPIMYVDSTGHSPEWWQWLISGLEIAAGIALCFVPGAQGFGVTLIGTGAGSMINGYINESNGGSFGAGWWGGQVSGFVSAIPGIGVPLGAFVGSVTTDWIDYGWDGIDLNKALVTSLIAWGASLFPTMVGEFASKYKIYDKAIYFVNACNTILTSTVNSIVNVYWRGKNIEK